MERTNKVPKHTKYTRRKLDYHMWSMSMCFRLSVAIASFVISNADDISATASPVTADNFHVRGLFWLHVHDSSTTFQFRTFHNQFPFLNGQNATIRLNEPRRRKIKCKIHRITCLSESSTEHRRPSEAMHSECLPV